MHLPINTSFLYEHKSFVKKPDLRILTYNDKLIPWHIHDQPKMKKKLGEITIWFEF